MQLIIGLVLGLSLSFIANAQTIPALAKVYSGNTVETSINASQKTQRYKNKV